MFNLVLESRLIILLAIKFEFMVLARPPNGLLLLLQELLQNSRCLRSNDFATTMPSNVIVELLKAERML